MRLRPLAALLLTLVASIAGVAAAQTGRRHATAPAPHAIPMAGTVIDWNVFVSAYGEAPSSRTDITASATPVTLPADAGWSCSVGVPTRAAIDSDHWSEVRTLECRRGDAILSTNGFCQIVGASWGARAAVLSLGSTAQDERVQVTVDCVVRN
jgi:hypothetical protein